MSTVYRIHFLKTEHKRSLTQFPNVCEESHLLTLWWLEFVATHFVKKQSESSAKFKECVMFVSAEIDQ